MRSLKSGLVTIAIAGLFATAAIVGCSADGGSGIESETTPTEPEPEAVLPPPSGGGSDSGPSKPDAGKKDSGSKPDTGVDAGPPPPVEGTPCTKADEIKKKKCGACGEASTVCIDDGTGKKWSAYSPCENELAGGCIPGTIVDEPCGNCGTVKKTCTQYCAYTSGACTGQPALNCKPGTVEYTTAGCAASTYRNRTCGAACTWGGYSATCAQPVNDIVLNITGGVGNTVTTTVTLDATQQGSRVSGTCPMGGSPIAGDYPYRYVELKNTLATSATVTVYTSQAAGGTVVDTILAVYDKAIQPMSDTDKKACKYGVNDQSYSDTALTGNADFSILKTIVIPAGASFLAVVTTYEELDATTTASASGPVNLNVKIDAL
jgi:hypothetical protein